MAGQKRKTHMMDGDQLSDSPYVGFFEGFRSELDAHHDRRERVIKASRDITALSKKIIFSLQRSRQIGAIHASISKQISPMYDTIKERFESVADDLRGMNAYRYQSNISGGVQEYMEAVLFHHYLETQKLLTHSEVAAKMPGGVLLTEEDYLLGVFDMTGELMRFSVTYMATNGKLPGGDAVGESMLRQMQAMRSFLESMSVAGHQDLKGFGSKLQVTRQSLGKIENSAYGMMVRGEEKPKGWMPETKGRGSPEPENN